MFFSHKESEQNITRTFTPKWVVWLEFPLFLSVLNLLPLKAFWQEISLSFGAYYLMHHAIVLTVVCIMWRRLGRMRSSGLLLASVFLSVFYLREIAPFYRTPETTFEARSAPRKIRLLYANVRTGNTNHSALKEVITREDPDIIVLLEIDTRWANQLNSLSQYPDRLVVAREDNFGIGVFSKIPFHDEPDLFLGESLPPGAFIQLEVDQAKEPLQLVVLHVPPPVSATNYHWARIIIRRVMTRLRHSPGSVILAGDFNATPFSPLYQRLLFGAELQNVMWGHGLQRTWNALNPLLRVSIDHILYRGAFRVSQAERLEKIGSDHFPLLVEFDFFT